MPCKCGVVTCLDYPAPPPCPHCYCLVEHTFEGRGIILLMTQVDWLRCCKCWNTVKYTDELARADRLSGEE